MWLQQASRCCGFEQISGFIFNFFNYFFFVRYSPEHMVSFREGQMGGDGLSLSLPVPPLLIHPSIHPSTHPSILCFPSHMGFGPHLCRAWASFSFPYSFLLPAVRGSAPSPAGKHTGSGHALGQSPYFRIVFHSFSFCTDSRPAVTKDRALPHPFLPLTLPSAKHRLKPHRF